MHCTPSYRYLHSKKAYARIYLYLLKSCVAIKYLSFQPVCRRQAEMTKVERIAPLLSFRPACYRQAEAEMQENAAG